MPEYRKISLPDEMVQEIEKLIIEYPELGHKTIASFVKSAIRLRIDNFRFLSKWGLEELEQEVLRRRQQSEQ